MLRVRPKHSETNNSLLREWFKASKAVGGLVWSIVKPSAVVGGTFGAVMGVASQWVRNILIHSNQAHNFKDYSAGYATKAAIGFTAMTVFTSISFFGYVLVKNRPTKRV
ncbi:MAG: hypothetical protein HZB76_06635 [Chlamydiae bacterium]|nr:hypothetical protein [Chlamydiota bacterium]